MALSMFLALILVYNVAADEYYNIAHMTNTVHAVDWAVQEGANAVELDLQFTANGQPDRFYHGPACDCTCRCPWRFSPLCSNPRFVCTALRIGSPHGGNPCYAESPVTTLLSHTARKSAIALVYIDSKIDDYMDDNIKQQAGRNVVRTLIDWLFGHGYVGNVIIGSFSSRSLSYVRAAVAAASSSSYSSKIFFSVELGSNNNFAGPHEVMRSLPTGNIIFGTGKSSCAPLSPHPQVTLEEARMNKDRGTISMAYTWTDDATSTIEHNLNYVQGIITNFPAGVRDVLRRTGRQLATRYSTIPAATLNQTFTNPRFVYDSYPFYPLMR